MSMSMDDLFHCKPGPDLNSHLTQGGRKRLNSVKYASPGAHLSQEKQRNRKVWTSLMWSIFDSAVPHSILWSQMRVEVGTGLTVQWHISLFWTPSLRPKIWSCQVTCDRHCKLEWAFCYQSLLAVDLPPRPVLSFRWRTAPLTCYTPIRASAGRSPRRAGTFAGQIVTRTVRAHRTVTRTKCRGTICIFSSQIRNVADIWNDCRSCEPSTQNWTSAALHQIRFRILWDLKKFV